MTTAQDWKYMTEALGEIRTSLAQIADRLQALELREAGCSPLMTSKVEAAFRRLDEHEARLKALEPAGISREGRLLELERANNKNTGQLDELKKAIPELQHSARLTAWAAGIASGTIILYIVNSVLHSIFPAIP